MCQSDFTKPVKQYVTISAKQLQVKKRKQRNQRVIVRITASTIYSSLGNVQIYNEGQYKKLCQYSKKNKRYELKMLNYHTF